MSPNALKKAVEEDLQSLKRFDLGVIPAKIYYRNLLLGWLLVYALLVSTQGIACLFALKIEAWGYVSEREQASADSERMSELMGFEHGSWEELQADRQKSEADRQEEREHQHLVRAFKMVTGVLFSSLFFMLFFVGKIKNYVIFKQQLLPRLQTGPYIAKKIRQAFKAYFVLFAVFSLITIPLFDQDMTIFAGIATFIFSSLAISVLIDMEASRIGISILSTAIVHYFDNKQRKKP